MALRHLSREWLLLCFVCLAGCSHESPAPRLVLVYAPCTVSKAHLSPYRSSVAYTPHLERFAAEAVRFERHQTEAPQSGIAYASILTGTQADRHGIFRHPQELAEANLVLFEPFADEGWDPWFWGAHKMATAALGYAQGVPAGQSFSQPLRSDDERFVRVVERLAADPSYRAVVFTHFMVTHGPYDPGPLRGFLKRYPELDPGLPRDRLTKYIRLYRANHFWLSWNPPAGRARLSMTDADYEEFAGVVDLLYLANVERLDGMFGRVLARLEEGGVADEAIVVFTADHGELMRRDNAPFQWSHSMQLGPEVIGVPLLIRCPRGHCAPGVYPQTTRSIDLLPTLLGLAGVGDSADTRFQGRDLSGALRSAQPLPELGAESHTTVLARAVARQMNTPQKREVWELARAFFPDERVEHIWAATRRRDLVFKLTRPAGGKFAVSAYDLASDPGETHDIFDARDPAHEAAAAELRDYKARLEASYRAQRSEEAERLLPRDEEKKALKSLGYIE